jgi:outer membrane receptor protein involved in Fe transport
MIDNIVINKAFVPEYPGEWAGGLIQVNTKDIPAKGFFNIQVGTGFNSQTIGKDFYKEKRGKLDWLGIDDGARALPSTYKTKSEFDLLTAADKTAIGKQMDNRWSTEASSAPVNVSFQANAGFNAKVFHGKKTLGGTFGITYNKSNKFIKLMNRSNSLSGNTFSINSNYDDDRYAQEILAGAIGSLSLQINPRNRVSVKTLLNINSSNSVTQRTGNDFSRTDEVKGSEFTFKQNIFYTVQLNGDHSLAHALKLKWYGAFNILDGYIPDQRRILYTRTAGTQDPFRLLISNTLSQQSGSRIYQSLSDYIYTAGGDLTYSFDWLGQKQALKGGYIFQVKDRLYDAKLFANYLPQDNDALRLLPADQVFTAQNFGNGTGALIGFDAIKSRNFRYMANTILNAGFLQLDNQFTKSLRVVWGLRVENYDQVVGSIKTWDPRHTHSKLTDYLPGVNATFKIAAKANLRLSGSQTVIRPELRELAFLNLYDFELNASVQGLPSLRRSKVTNFDLRYELYPRAAETFSVGVFYKDFTDPIEAIFNEGSGGASSFNYQNVHSARSFGAEIELRKKLDFTEGLKNFTFQANIAYIRSRIQDEKLDIDRPLQGQSPYVVNVGLLYDLEKSGFSTTLLFNQIGERIYLAGDITAGAGSPDIYEAPRPLLDLQVAKKLLKNKAEIRLSVADIINKTQYFYQNGEGKASFQKGIDAYRFTRHPGTNYSITFNYSL